MEAERVRFENARLTRRQALRKFGFMAGMTIFATLSIDDLARIAARKLQETEMTKGIGDTLAKEFRDAGVALANPEGGDPYGDYEYMAKRPKPKGDPNVCEGPVANCEACQASYHESCVKIRGYAATKICTDMFTACEDWCDDSWDGADLKKCWETGGKWVKK